MKFQLEGILMMKENKLKVAVATVGSMLILGYATLQFVELSNIHKANQQIIEECFQSWADESTLKITKAGVGELVPCEKE